MSRVKHKTNFNFTSCFLRHKSLDKFFKWQNYSLKYLSFKLLLKKRKRVKREIRIASVIEGFVEISLH